MPGRIIVVFVLMAVRVLVNAVIIVRSVGAGAPVQRLQNSLAIFEFGFALFVLIALRQRKYLAIRVFRPYVVASSCGSMVWQAYSSLLNYRENSSFAVAPIAGGAALLVFFLWFQWYVADPGVRAYLSHRGQSSEPPILAVPLPERPSPASDLPPLI
jgi:hypothetical protein